jgi:cholesterol oxidase
MPRTDLPRTAVGERAASWMSHGLEALVAEHPELARSGPPPAEPLFDVVIVGSGYGAAVVAAGLAGRHNSAGQPLRVCVLERGREYLAGQV